MHEAADSEFSLSISGIPFAARFTSFGMVNRYPLFGDQGWAAKRFRTTVLNDIWPEVIVFTLVSTIVVLVSEFTSVHLGVSNQLLTVLGLVLGLVISFRTSSAYERYQEGKKLWTTIMYASRHLAQLIWVHVQVSPSTVSPVPITATFESVLEKKTMINLIQAFSISVKHLLRGEQGVYYDDLYPLISFLPRYASESGQKIGSEHERLPIFCVRDEAHRLVNPSQAFESNPMYEKGPEGGFLRPTRTGTTFDPECLLPQVESPFPLRPARNPPLSSFLRWIWKALTLQRWRKNKTGSNPTKRRRKAGVDNVESQIPLEICLVLSNYSAYLMQNGLVQSSVASGMITTLALFQDTVSNLERICNTPLPFAYQAHLRLSLWIYLTLLPFQIYTAYRFITIPATAFASFLLLGFLEIGQEIENPFDYDYNDLDLDYFCLSIQRDLHQITAYTNPNPREIVFTKMNQPLAPSDRRSAADLVENSNGSRELGLPGIRRTLVAGWREVDNLTREGSNRE